MEFKAIKSGRRNVFKRGDEGKEYLNLGRQLMQAS